MDTLITAANNILPFQSSGYKTPPKLDLSQLAFQKTAMQFEAAAIDVTGHGKTKTKHGYEQ